MTKAYVDFDVPESVSTEVYDTIEKISRKGKLAKGVNEVTKAIERGLAKLVVIATDVDPEEIVMHIPLLCKEKEIPYIYVPRKQELGAAAGISVSASTVAVVDDGGEAKALEAIAKKARELARAGGKQEKEKKE